MNASQEFSARIYYEIFKEIEDIKNKYYDKEWLIMTKEELKILIMKNLKGNTSLYNINKALGLI